MRNYSISAIIPVGPKESRVALCLENLLRLSPPVDEVLIIADGTNELAQAAAKKFGVSYVESKYSKGPANARNQGAFVASRDILLFVDADVLIPSDLVSKIKVALNPENGILACFGSYDDAPVASNFFSQYKNLFHHYVHQESCNEASTFWTGCGAVFSDVFKRIGGFDEKFFLPSVEDIEFGYRLRDAGYRIRLIHSLQVKHLKRWNAFSLLHTDFFQRAIPWSRMLLSRSSIPQELNLKMSSRVSGLAAVALLIGFFLIPFDWQIGSIISILAICVGGVLNIPLYRFFKRKRGLLFTTGVFFWTWFYYFYSTLGFVVALIQHWWTSLFSGFKHTEKSNKNGAQISLD